MTGSAQQANPSGPVYVVQPGDSLWEISLRFGITIADLEKANGITNANQLSVGSKLVIPGLEGLQGTLITHRLNYGDTLQSLSRRYGLSVEDLARLNHLTSPGQLFAGANLILLQSEETVSNTQRLILAPGQSLFELAVVQHINPWSLVARNTLTGTWSALAGDVLLSPGVGSEADTPGALPDAIRKSLIKPLPLVQGRAAEIQLEGPAGLTLSGSLADHKLAFFPKAGGGYIALQGVHALADPGLYPLTITGTLPGGIPFRFSQNVYFKDGGYPYDPALTVSPETVDPAVTKPEDAEWSALATTASPKQMWSGQFKSPAPAPYDQCWPSIFGSRRSFNGSAYIYFHSGLDFCGGVGTKIFAPASGIVIFAGPLTVRGNATMIDHGWGVYTGYMHQSEIDVKVGDHVEAGQQIGLVGGTGRVTGPHLHWEVFVGGIQVDPQDWLKQNFP